MKIAVCCCTYLRPIQLGWIVAMFQSQTYKDAVLLILDDAGQYIPQGGDNWLLISGTERFKSLGEKRNRSMEAAAGYWKDIDAFCPWDDDDLYLPWQLEITAAALEQGEWSMPSRVLHLNQDGSFRQHLTGPGTFYHAGMGFSRDVFNQCGGYPAWSGPEDQGLFRRLEEAHAKVVDPISLTGKPPAYCWCGDIRQPIPHISGMLGRGDNGEWAWYELGKKQQPGAAKAKLDIGLPPFFTDTHLIHEAIKPRPF